MSSEASIQTWTAWRVVVGAGSILAIAGCASPAEKLVKEYLDQKACADRANFILEPEKYKTVLAKYYADNKDCVTEHGKIDASGCGNVAVGDYCSVAVGKIDSPYCLKRTTSSKYRIDWPCSTG